MACLLLGPPSFRDASANCGNGNNDDDERLMMGFTENMSATFLNTGKPCFDFFFKVVPNTPSLEKAWAFNRLMTLKLICNLRGVRGTGNEEEREVAELQWKRLVEDMKQKGTLRNCIAICDVSRSMEGTPMGLSVALGVLVSELSEEPWKGKLITFSEEKVHRFKMLKGSLSLKKQSL